MEKTIKGLLKALLAVLFLFCASPCGADKFCDFIDRVQGTHCPTTSITSTTTSICVCPTTTTTSLPVPEFCGETTRDEIDDLITATHETFWDYPYRLISVDSLKEFLRFTVIEDIPTGDYNWHDCDDYAKRLLGKVMEWAPGIAFGIAWVTNEDRTSSHAVNVMIDCNLDVWRIEPQWNRIDLWDETSHVILLGEQ